MVQAQLLPHAETAFATCHPKRAHHCCFSSIFVKVQVVVFSISFSLTLSL
jgi:hypothetical protein